MILGARPRRGNRRRRKAAADFVLEVSTHSRAARRQRRRLLVLWAVRLVLIAGFGWGAFVLGLVIFDRFFFSNPEYTLRRLELTLNDLMTREEALELAGLREGVNIFSVDLSRVEKALAGEATVARVRIERQLPDTLRIVLEPRQAIAWVELPAGNGSEPPIERTPENGFLVDASGLLMKPRRLTAQHLGLPAIRGVPCEGLAAGSHCSHEGLLGALEVLAECARRPELPLRPRSFDVSRGWRVDVSDASGPTFFLGLEDIGSQLDRLHKLMIYSSESGREIQTANLMVRRNTPVTFVMARPPAPVQKQEKRR